MRCKRIPGNALLFALATQGFETYHLLGHFVVTEDQRVQRTALVGLLELAFETARAGIHLQAQVGQLVTNALRQGQPGELGGFTEGAEIDINLTEISSGICSRVSSNSTRRSMPMAKPTPAVGLPPICSTRPS